MRIGGVPTTTPASNPYAVYGSSDEVSESVTDGSTHIHPLPAVPADDLHPSAKPDDEVSPL
jgi:hypothetical protein